MYRIAVLTLAAVVGLIPGCSWQKIPPPPTYADASPIALIVGVELAQSPATQAYGSGVVEQLKDKNVFQFVIWPFNPNTPVDAVLKLSIDGSWKQSKGQTFTSAILVGLTLGLLGPFLGPKTSGSHHVIASLESSGETIVAYDYHVETKYSTGLSANKDAARFQAVSTQTQKIAVELASRLNADRAKIETESPPAQSRR
jgi:hypothetical protein